MCPPLSWRAASTAHTRLVADGARDVDDDLLGVFAGGIELLVDGGKGAEKLLNNVGQHGCFPGGNTVLGEEDEEFAEDEVHVLGGTDIGEIAEEEGSEVLSVALRVLDASVLQAEAERFIEDSAAAATPGGGMVPAAKRVIARTAMGGARVRGARVGRTRACRARVCGAGNGSGAVHDYPQL